MRRARCRRATAVAAYAVVANRQCLGFQIPTNTPQEVAVHGSGSSRIWTTRPRSTRDRVDHFEARPPGGRCALEASLCGSGGVRGGKGMLLYGRRDGDGGGNFAQEFEQMQPFTEVMRSNMPRRYIGEDAGTGDETGVGGPRGDGRGQRWTVDLCTKRLSLLHRKLRQVKDLLAKKARDPDSLDAAQLVKVDRKMDLQLEISELEALRRNLIRSEKDGGGIAGDDRATGGRIVAAAKGKLAPGPFAGVSKSSIADGNAEPLSQTEGPSHEESEQFEARDLAAIDDGARYTRDGYKLAAPRRPEKSASLPSSSVRQVGTEEERETGGGASGNGEDFSWDEGFDGRARADDEFVPTGGYPTRLASAMSFCRVSTKATCEVLIALGRVTVNGEPANSPMQMVDVLTDLIVCNGVVMTLPPKIDNSDDTKKPRTDLDTRTGPIPKAEKNTWKTKVKYRWATDDGLLATRTRRAANAKAFRKKARGAGGGGGGDYY